MRLGREFDHGLVSSSRVEHVGKDDKAERMVDAGQVSQALQRPVHYVLV